MDDHLTFPYGPAPRTPTSLALGQGEEDRKLKKRASSFFVDTEEVEVETGPAEEETGPEAESAEFVDGMDIEELIDLLLVKSTPTTTKNTAKPRRAMFLSCPRMSDILEVEDELEFDLEFELADGDGMVLTPRSTNRTCSPGPLTPTPGRSTPTPDQRCSTPTPFLAQKVAESSALALAKLPVAPVTPPRPTRPAPPAPTAPAQPASTHSAPPAPTCSVPPTPTLPNPPAPALPTAPAPTRPVPPAPTQSALPLPSRPQISTQSSAPSMSTQPSPVPTTPRSRRASADTSSTAEWHSSVASSRVLEDVFANMLITEHGIHLAAHQQLELFMEEVFGAGNSSKTRSIHIKLANGNGGDQCTTPSSDYESDRASIDSGYASLNMENVKEETSAKRKTFGSLKGRGKLGRTDSSPSSTTSTSSDGDSDSQDASGLSAKAADRLGITYSALGHATATSKPQTATCGPGQSLGVIVWPDTFIPMTGTELEMHTCRHMHSLLGAKAAIVDFLVKAFPSHSGEAESDPDPNSDTRSIRSVATMMSTATAFTAPPPPPQSLVSLQELEDALWDYEWYVFSPPTSL